MERITVGIMLCVLISCSNVDLQDGIWTGSFSPMNHPESVSPIMYDVTHRNDVLAITLVGPDSLLMRTRGLRLTPDTLYFVFDEPEAGVALECALARAKEDRYEGRCEDADGKWATFTMVPPPS
jgi:hypothetical protein